MNFLKYIIPIILIIGAYLVYSNSNNSIVKQSYDGNYIYESLFDGDRRIILNDSLYCFEQISDTLFKESVDGQSLLNRGQILLSRNNNGSIKIGETGIEELLQPQLFNIKLIADSSLEGKIKTSIDNVNKVLAILNSGIQISTLPSKTRGAQKDSLEFRNLSKIKTNGKININKLYDRLEVGDSDTIHVYLFEDSEFFNTANAVALNSIDDDDNNHIAILGNGYLLESPYLFAHELFHGLGLTHHNEVYKGCATEPSNISRYSVFNVMNESNIGCSRRLSARQIMILDGNSYYPRLKEEILFPEEEICNCHYGNLGNDIERYLNSFDKNIDDTPLIGDDDAFFKKIISLGDSIMPSYIEKPIKLNYLAESREMFNGSENIPYVEKRLEIHRKLRMYNLCRWLKENAELKGLKMQDDFWELDSLSLINNMVNYYYETQKEFCAFGCNGNGNKCQSDFFDCEFCPYPEQEIPEEPNTEPDSISTEGRRQVLPINLSKRSKTEIAFATIVANYFNDDDLLKSINNSGDDKTDPNGNEVSTNTQSGKKNKKKEVKKPSPEK